MRLLYKSKAIGRYRKGQKEKPIIITTWAVAESFNPNSGLEKRRLSKRWMWD
jgi:hypothetical protein